MGSFQLRRIAKCSILRALLLGAMGILTLLLPKLLNGGIVYMIAVYAILNGVLGIADFISYKGKEEKTIAYFNVIVAGLAIICGGLCIVYFRYLVSSLPVFLGLLLIIESIVHFVTALCAKSKLKVLLIIITFLLAIGGVALIIFTFGFGGLTTLSKLFGGLLFLSCISEMLIFFIYKMDKNIQKKTV